MLTALDFNNNEPADVPEFNDTPPRTTREMSFVQIISEYAAHCARLGWSNKDCAHAPDLWYNQEPEIKPEPCYLFTGAEAQARIGT